jgi:aarF domain-containing kinase
VLLDHGLYRDFDESFRLSYCRLWRAIVLLDSDELQEAGRQLGAGEFTRYLPIIFTGRGMGSKSELGQAMSAEEQKVLKEEVRRFTMADISNWMEGLPREFLTILRTDGLVRSISNKLGASRRSRLIAYVKYAVAGLAIEVRGEPSKHFSIEVFLTIMAADFMRFSLVVACGVRSCGENRKAVSSIHFLT